MFLWLKLRGVCVCHRLESFGVFPLMVCCFSEKVIFQAVLLFFPALLCFGPHNQLQPTVLAYQILYWFWDWSWNYIHANFIVVLYSLAFWWLSYGVFSMSTFGLSHAVSIRYALNMISCLIKLKVSEKATSTLSYFMNKECWLMESEKQFKSVTYKHQINGNMTFCTKYQ